MFRRNRDSLETETPFSEDQFKIKHCAHCRSAASTPPPGGDLLGQCRISGCDPGTPKEVHLLTRSPGTHMEV